MASIAIKFVPPSARDKKTAASQRRITSTKAPALKYPPVIFLPWPLLRFRLSMLSTNESAETTAPRGSPCASAQADTCTALSGPSTGSETYGLCMATTFLASVASLPGLEEGDRKPLCQAVMSCD